jgi:hypothetical protein
LDGLAGTRSHHALADRRLAMSAAIDLLRDADRDCKEVTRDTKCDQRDGEPCHEICCVTSKTTGMTPLVTPTLTAAERKRRQREREKAADTPLTSPREASVIPRYQVSDLHWTEIDTLVDFWLKATTDALAGHPDREAALRCAYRAVELDSASRRARAAEEAVR